MIACNRSKEHCARTFGLQRSKACHQIDYDKYLKPYINKTKPEEPPDKPRMDSQKDAALLKKHKDHIVLGKEMKILETYKKISDIQVCSNAAGAENSSGDNFVLTRRLNHPELIYNQRLSRDSTKDRFFKVDANQAWALSHKDECYMCEKHHYTCIFYERGTKTLNNGLIEIKDLVFLDLLRKDY